MYNNFESLQQHQESSLKMATLPRNAYHEFLSVISGKQKYIAKVFLPNQMNQYQKERRLLDTLTHPNITKPLCSTHLIVGKLSAQLKGDVLVFTEAGNGNLMDYIARYGGLSQKVAKFYLKKIVGALIYAKKSTEISHPNLTLANILMKENRDISLCGWPNSLQATKESPSVEIGRLAMQLVTGRDPFPNKEIKKSQFYKFLTDDHIAKFWQQIEKSIRSRSKNFSFSLEFKKIVGLLLLDRLTSYEEIDKICLNQQHMSVQEVRNQLECHQKMVEGRRTWQFNKC